MHEGMPQFNKAETTKPLPEPGSLLREIEHFAEDEKNPLQESTDFLVELAGMDLNQEDISVYVDRAEVILGQLEEFLTTSSEEEKSIAEENINILKKFIAEKGASLH